MLLPIVDKAQLGACPWKFPARKYMNRGEPEVIMTLLHSVKPQSMIEFGVNVGLTAEAVLNHIPTIRHYVGVDVPETYRTILSAQQSEVTDSPGALVYDDPRFKLVLRDYTSPSFDSEQFAENSFDAAFIDGDHGYDWVIRDYETAKRCIRPNGIIIFHDYNNPHVQVTEALNFIFSQGNQVMSVAGTWLAFERL